MKDELKRNAQGIAKKFELFVLDAIEQDIYENFEGFGTNSYFSWYFGVGGRYDFGKGIYLDVDLLYMPSIDPFADDWLFRSFVDFTVPLFDPIALKLLLANVNDDNPSPDVGNNKFTATMALSLEF